jgi:all-trans-retinol 13,14-reductase
MMKYHVVVTGSGLGGLISGFILSKEGLNVCVLEQHHKIGGNLQTFSRDGCIFDTGMHYIGSMEEGQYLHKYFKYFELTKHEFMIIL